MAWAAALILGSVLLMASAADAQPLPAARMLVDPDARLPAPAEGRGTIVFLKPLADSMPAEASGPDTTVSLFVDGTYHASLPRASWAYAEVCPGAHFLTAVQDKAILAITEASPAGQRFEIAAASTAYFRLIENGQGTPRLEPMEAGAAAAALQSLPKAVHTLSRLQAKNCDQPAEASPQPSAMPLPQGLPAPAAPTNYTLRASAFFDFDNARMSFKRGQGQAELDEIVRRVRTQYMTVKNIEVIGYADPTGSAAYNLRLSRERAETVASYVARAGLGSAAITTRGMGATRLLVPDCAVGLKTPEQVHACNEPNRRVELVVHGEPKSH